MQYKVRKSYTIETAFGTLTLREGDRVDAHKVQHVHKQLVDAGVLDAPVAEPVLE